VPIYLEISRLHRCVTIVARADISPEEIAGAWRKITGEGVSHFAKLIDISAATSGITREQVEQITRSLPGRSPEAERGPVAFLVDPKRPGFAALFAEMHDTRRVGLFTSLHRARDWLTRTLETGWNITLDPDEEATAGRAASDPWSDPDREATMYRRSQRRDVPIHRGRPSYAMG
jgi:hypothetical protein